MNERYASIISRGRIYSEKHPQMSNRERAAQFAPFAALTGYDDAVEEMARLTTNRIILTDDKMVELDRRLQLAVQMRDAEPEITVVYFLPDKKKSGGAYMSKTGCLTGIKANTIRFTDGETIPISDIYEVHGALFDCLEE